MNFGVWNGKQVFIKLRGVDAVVYGALVGVDEGMVFVDNMDNGMGQTTAYPIADIRSVKRFAYQDWIGRRVSIRENPTGTCVGTLVRCAARFVQVADCLWDDGTSTSAQEIPLSTIVSMKLHDE